MLPRNRLVPFILLLLIAALFLAACERPIPGSDAEEDQAAELNEDAGDAGPEAADSGGSTDAADGAADAPAADETTGDDSSSADSDTEPAEEDAAAAEPTEEDAAATDEGTETGDEAEEPADSSAAEEQGDDSAADTDMSAGETGAATEIPAEHVVVAGESLYEIGLQYDISWVAIAEANQLTPPYKILVGQTLTLPQPAAAAEEGEETSTATETTYIVKPGDNLFRIGLAYGITWVQLAEANGLVNPNQIFVGQTLKIPVDTPGPAPNFTHVVKPGETLYLISLQYGVSWTAIAEANDLSSPYVIFVGETLTIPGGE